MGGREDMATSSLHLKSMECRDAPAERLEAGPQARARQQRDPATVQAGVHAISIELDLMQPFHSLRRRIDNLQSCGLTHLGDWAIGPATHLSSILPSQLGDQARRTKSRVRCLIDGTPTCCMAARASLRRISRTRSTTRLTEGRQPPQIGPSDTNSLGTHGQSLDDIRAATEAAVHEDSMRPRPP